MDALTIISSIAILASVAYAVYSYVKNKKVDVTKIFSIADIAVRYVEQVYKLDSNEKKKDFAAQRIIDILKSMGIKVDESIMKLIDVAIEGAVQKLPKTRPYAVNVNMTK